MLQVSYFTFNAFQENTYLISDSAKRCWIVDPGMYHNDEVNIFRQHIEEKQLTPVAIINTHAHLDHIFGVQALKDFYKIPFGVHKDEEPVLKMAPNSAAMFGFDGMVVPTPDFFISEKEPLKLGDDEVKVMLTPGHSPGSISFYYEPGAWVISGDVLFSGSIGRTDLPGGNFDTLINSIRTHLLPLPDKTQVLSGHGTPTRIDTEKKYNPYLNA